MTPESAAMDDNATGIEAAPAGPAGEAETLRQTVIEAVSSVYDPEIPVNIYELGLIYDVSVSETREVEILMTLTSPMCPVAESLPIEVESRVRGVDDVHDVHVELTWDPPWTPEMMSEAAKLELGFM